MTGPPPRTRRELSSRALAVIACLGFVLGLFDTSRLRARRTSALEPVPTPFPERALVGSLVTNVRAESGQAIADTTVQVYSERDGRFDFASASSSDGRGRAVLRKLPLGRLWVLAEAPGYARRSSSLVLGAAERVLTLTLPVARSLRVSVEDETHAAIAGATVIVETFDPLPFGALGDEHGVVSFTRLGPPPFVVKASARGYESVAREGVKGDIVVALRKLAALEVQVLAADGTPAPGATVMIAGATLWPARSALTNSLGATRIGGLLAGDYDLRASAGSAVSPTRLGFALARGTEARVSLRLEPGRNVVAFVTDGEGSSAAPVGGADVVLTESGLSSFPIRGRTASDGQVVLGPIAGGPASLAARAEDYVSSALVSVPETSREPVRVPLLRGATLHGTVHDARGFGVDGVTVEVVGTDPNGLPIADTPALVAFRQSHFAWSLGGPPALVPAGELGVMPGPVPPIPRLGVDNRAPVIGSPGPTIEMKPWLSDRTGHFTARPVTPGRVRAIVRHPDYVEAASAFVTVAPGGDGELDITLRKGGALEGRVLDERELPQAGVRVELTSPNSSLRDLTRTASDGSFAFAAVPEEITLSLGRAEDPSRPVLRTTLRVPEGERRELTLVLPAMRDAIRVLVLDENERPIELAQLSITSLEATRPLRLTRFTDSAGAVTIDDALGENLRVVGEAPGFSRISEVVAQAPRELRLTMKHGLSVSGRVTSVRGRQAVSGATVTLTQGGAQQTAYSDADGRFGFRDVTSGEAQLRAEHAPELAGEELVVRVADTGRADRSFVLPEIELQEAGEIEGEVLTAEGEPCAGASVFAGPLRGDSAFVKLAQGAVRSDGEGRFVLRGVHPGRAVVSASSSTSGVASVSGVEVASGRTTRGLRITLAAAAAPSASLAPASVAITLGERADGKDSGLVVLDVADGSEAERAGIRAGDALYAVDGERAASLAGARERLSGQPGSDVLLEVERGGVKTRFRVVRELPR